MKKIRLDLDGLDVVSFSTAQEQAPRGTVEGHDSGYTECNCGYPTWYNACHPTVTYGEETCICMVPVTDIRYCNTDRECGGNGASNEGMC